MGDIREPIAAPFESTFYARQTGLVGTVSYKILDNVGNETQASTTAGILEISPGLYAVASTTPGTVGQFSIVWSRDGTYEEHTLGIDALETFDPGVSPPTVPELVPMGEDEFGLGVGPCQAWTTSDDVAQCCGVEAGSDVSIFDDSVVAASQLLYALVPRFSGQCGPRRVFPCGMSQCRGPWGQAPVAWSSAGWTWDFTNVYDPPPASSGCGCSPVKSIPLAGWVREILEVTIDGSIIDPSTYEVRDHRRLVRVRVSADDELLEWPSCSDETLPYTEPGTFSILYTYGLPVPVMGQLAARELACAIYQSCSAAMANSDECVLPNNVVKVIRQGITIEMKAFTGWGYDGKQWATGMPLVDAFLNAYNPKGRRRRRTSVWSPDLDRYPRRGAVEVGS